MFMLMLLLMLVVGGARALTGDWDWDLAGGATGAGREKDEQGRPGPLVEAGALFFFELTLSLIHI